MTELEFKILLNEKLCDLADALLHYYNPCGCVNDICWVSKDPANKHLHCCINTKFDKLGDETRVCEFLQGNRCGFRNIGCKLFLCATAISKSPQCAQDFKDLENLARRYGLVRRPFLGERYAGRTEELERLKGQDK
jgi:hypothetical protein